MLILDLWGISFHALVVFGQGKNLLFKSMLRRCVLTETIMKSFFRAIVVMMPNSPLVWFAKLNKIVLPDHTTKMKITSNWLRLLLRFRVNLGRLVLPTPSNIEKLDYVCNWCLLISIKKKSENTYFEDTTCWFTQRFLNRWMVH